MLFLFTVLGGTKEHYLYAKISMNGQKEVFLAIFEGFNKLIQRSLGQTFNTWQPHFSDVCQQREIFSAFNFDIFEK